MKTEEDEAFDELAKKQGMWGGGFHAKKAMAMDKCQGMNCQKSDVNPEHSLECEAEHAATIAGGYFVKTTPPAQPAEIQRLTAELKKANDQAEHFEREWYLRGDEIERLKAAQSAQEPVNQRAHETALRQWEHWKTYALELQERLVKYEGGAPMVLNSIPQPAQEPVTWMVTYQDGSREVVYETPSTLNPDISHAVLHRPQQRPWVGLTNGEIADLEYATDTLEFSETVRAIEQLLKEKNNGT